MFERKMSVGYVGRNRKDRAQGRDPPQRSPWRWSPRPLVRRAARRATVSPGRGARLVLCAALRRPPGVDRCTPRPEPRMVPRHRDRHRRLSHHRAAEMPGPTRQSLMRVKAGRKEGLTRPLLPRKLGQITALVLSRTLQPRLDYVLLAERQRDQEAVDQQQETDDRNGAAPETAHEPDRKRYPAYQARHPERQQHQEWDGRSDRIRRQREIPRGRRQTDIEENLAKLEERLKAAVYLPDIDRNHDPERRKAEQENAHIVSGGAWQQRNHEAADKQGSQNERQYKLRRDDQGHPTRQQSNDQCGKDTTARKGGQPHTPMDPTRALEERRHSAQNQDPEDIRQQKLIRHPPECQARHFRIERNMIEAVRNQFPHLRRGVCLRIHLRLRLRMSDLLQIGG